MTDVTRILSAIDRSNASATALVHEAYLRLVHVERVQHLVPEWTADPNGLTPERIHLIPRSEQP
jgi:hypothetical protein